MSNSFLNRNLASLKKKGSALFEKITSVKSLNFYAVTKSKSGSPALIHIDSEGLKKQIDSNYDPVGEAARYYRSNSHILSEKELSKDYCLLDEEFARDLKFLDVLSDSVEYLRVNFEKSLSP